MKKLLLVALLSGFSMHALAQDAGELLKASDRARGGIKGGVVWEAKITTVEDGESSERTFAVKAKSDDAHVESLAPARNKGEVFLFNDRNMWFFKPSLRKPVSISARQKLSGQAANGDIASTNYARDYTATVVGDEKVNGQDTKVLLLKAKSNQVTYDQVKYWVSKKDKLALKAEFMTLQGTPFKVATFEYKNTMAAEGKKFPFISKMVIQDSKFPANQSTIEYTKPQAEELSSSLFNVNNLSR
ncbi:outer membrane lipoprotein-sorting protein [Bdellovibrio sp. HCB337]|uniref:outer membrane lipoprotein-sorting protein n=1 Tax=Bdellovibrio sp. HCB337 TaxID=3394358 RepID=UPI0039A62B0D